MSQEVVAVVAALALGAAALAVAFVVGMRAKSPLVQRPIIWISKTVLNKRQLRTAGTPGAYAAIIRHRGRTSGRIYETPIGVEADGDDFVVALPYGTSASWLRNVLAAGSATHVYEGQTLAVDRPEIMPMQGLASRFSVGDQRNFRLFNVDRCLRLRRVEHHRATADPVIRGSAPHLPSAGSSRAIRQPRA